jgi:hypothetical protein
MACRTKGQPQIARMTACLPDVQESCGAAGPACDSAQLVAGALRVAVYESATLSCVSFLTCLRTPLPCWRGRETCAASDCPSASDSKLCSGISLHTCSLAFARRSDTPSSWLPDRRRRSISCCERNISLFSSSMISFLRPLHTLAALSLRHTALLGACAVLTTCRAHELRKTCVAHSAKAANAGFDSMPRETHILHLIWQGSDTLNRSQSAVHTSLLS